MGFFSSSARTVLIECCLCFLGRAEMLPAVWGKKKKMLSKA